MRLFGYYALHTFKNQLKKLFKTWVLVFLLVCALLGGFIGFFVASLSDDGPEDAPYEEEVLPPEDGDVTLDLGADTAQLGELIAGVLILGLFLFMAMGADKNGSRIFLPADVNILFPSPMRPQAVLLFRLATQLGMSLLAGFYLLMQLPNLVDNLGMSVWSALTLVAAFCAAVLTGTLIRVLLYILAATYPAVKRALRPAVYAILVLLAGGFLAARTGGRDLLQAALRFFNAPFTRYIPFWGWLKAACGCAIAGRLGASAVYMAVTLLGGAALVAVIWRIRADFYEDAMAKSEETAELLARAQSEKGAGVAVRRKKDRSGRLRRDGMRRGAGANVFFFKAMYNRFRFAHLGFLTKTLEFYLAAALAVGLLLRRTGTASAGGVVALVLGGLVFFRALGNSLEQDAGMDSFLLIPESTWAKLFWSLMGVTANCLLDVLPALLAGALAAGASVAGTLAWAPLIVAVDFYATTVGAFIGFSVPVNAGRTIKQIVQVMFVYFGLLPDIVIIALGAARGAMFPASILAAGVNGALGLVFFALTPLFLDPRSRPAPIRAGAYTAPAGSYAVPTAPSPAPAETAAPIPVSDLPAARRLFSRIGFSAFTILALGTALQAGAAVLALVRWPGQDQPGWVMWLVTFLPLYAVAIPVGLAILRRVPAAPPEKRGVTAGQAVTAVLVSLFMMYAGNLAGTLITAALQALLGAEATNPILAYATDGSVVYKIAVMVLAAPLIEEYLFRKTLIDRMRPYGEKLAVITSAAVFGLFHGNLGQLFYAAALGLVFGYVYLRTGRLRYSVALHMLINFLGSVAAPAILEAAGPDGTGWALAAYSYGMIALSLAGLVLLCVRGRDIRFAPAERELPRGSRFRTVWLNPGMLLFFALCLVSIALTFAV